MVQLNFNEPKMALSSSLKILNLIAFPAYLLIYLCLPANMTYLVGQGLGILATMAFLLSLLPGIIHRFQWRGVLGHVGSFLRVSRKQLGMSMFVLAAGHYLFLRFISIVRFGFPSNVAIFELFGVLAFYLTLPLFLTSNKPSKRWLKKNWTRLHTLVYVIIWVLFLHIALQFHVMAIPVGLVAALELASLIKAFAQKPKKHSDL